MPPNRDPTLSSAQAFTIPGDSHLVITTPSNIYTWDSAGIHIIFSSSKRGIVAAAAARTKDGAPMLAVADRQVVVLHDTARGQERSWGLKAGDEEVRSLLYSRKSKALYLSTNMTNAIQRFSIEHSRLLSPSQQHASPPNALAVSSSGHLMVSASWKPPAVYLSNLQHKGTPSTLLMPRASTSAVSSVKFHPEI